MFVDISVYVGVYVCEMCVCFCCRFTRWLLSVLVGVILWGFRCGVCDVVLVFILFLV